MAFPKLIPFKVGTSTFVTCEKHGTFAVMGLTEEGTCSRCDNICRGCGEPKDSLALASALRGAGRRPNMQHEHCEQKTDGFFMERKSCDHQCSGECRRSGCNCECGEWHEDKYEKDYEPPDDMLVAKDSKYA